MFRIRHDTIAKRREYVQPTYQKAFADDRRASKGRIVMSMSRMLIDWDKERRRKAK